MKHPTTDRSQYDRRPSHSNTHTDGMTPVDDLFIPSDMFTAKPRELYSRSTATQASRTQPQDG